MPDHGHPISSPCEPNGSGELINRTPISWAQYVGATNTFAQRLLLAYDCHFHTTFARLYICAKLFKTLPVICEQFSIQMPLIQVPLTAFCSYLVLILLPRWRPVHKENIM